MFHSLLTTFFEDQAEHVGADHLSGNPDFSYTRMHAFWFYLLCSRGSKFVANLINAYQMFVGKPRKKYYDEFYDITKKVSKDGCSLTTFIFNSIKRLGIEGSKKLVTQGIFNASYIDTVLPTTLQLITRWSHELDDPFLVIHDKSYALEKRNRLIEYLNNLTDKPKRIIQSKADPELIWPLLRINIEGEIKFEDSKDHYGLQVADLLAGAFNDCARAVVGTTSKDDINRLFDQLTSIVEDKNFIHMIPDLNFANSWEREYIRLSHADFLCSTAFKNAIRKQKMKDNIRSKNKN